MQSLLGFSMFSLVFLLPVSLRGQGTEEPAASIRVAPTAGDRSTTGELADAPGKWTAPVATRDAQALSQAIRKELAQALNVKRVAMPAVVDSEEEAARFLREVEFHMERQDFARSLVAAEAAFALRPSDPYYRGVLARSLLQNANELVNLPGPSVTPETLARSLSFARRGSELLLDVQSIPPEVKMPLNWRVVKNDADGTLLNYLPALRNRGKTLTAEERTAVEAIQKNHNRCLDIQLGVARKALRDKRSFDAYTLLVDRGMMSNAGDSFLPATQWADLLCRLRDWAEIARKYEDEKATFSVSLLWDAVESYGVPRQLTAADVARLRKFWSDLEDHPNATIAVYGKLGSVVNSVTFGKLTEADARSRVSDFRLFVQGMLEKGEELPIDRRLNLYQAATAAFSNNQRLRLPGHFEERKELCEFMLRRKEVFAPLVMAIGESVVFYGGKLEQYRSAHDLLKRALELLEGDKGVFLSNAATPMALQIERDRFRSAVLRLQASIRVSNPSAGPATVVPWSKVMTLIDVQPNTKGILWLQRPVVHEGSVYTAAVRMEEMGTKFALQLLRLTPGKLERWEGKPLAVTLRLPATTGLPTTGPNRHGLNFGSAAHIHQDRYYLGTKGHGIFVFPFDNGPPERISTADGLPSNSVQALVCHEGRLYACLGEPFRESYVVAWDLKTRKCDVLASSNREEKRSPFDHGAPIQASVMLADPARGRILLVAFGNAGDSPLNGLWTLDIKSSEWKRLLPLQLIDRSLYGPQTRVEGDRLIFNGAVGNLVYDLAKSGTQLLFDGKVSLDVNQPKSLMGQLGTSPAYKITKDEFLNVRPPHTLVDGWVWGAAPFSRRRFDSSKVEYLPPLRNGRQYFFPTECLQLFRGDREVLVGDAFGIWLVTLRKD